MRLVHVFDNGSTTRTLSATGTARLSGFVGRSQAPGGYTDATGTISAAEFDAHSSIYAYGTIWRVYDLDDADNVPTLTSPCWGGTLTDPEKSGGNVTLQGQGWGKKAAKYFSRLLWQTFDLGEWATGDTDPFSYPVDEQIEGRINGRSIDFRVRHKSVFLRPGHGFLDPKANSGDTSITLGSTPVGINPGDSIKIGSETKTVHSSYSSGSTTVPLTAALASDHQRGTSVSWPTSNSPDPWETTLVFWAPDATLQWIGYTIALADGGDSAYDLEVLRGTGPTGGLTVEQTISLTAGNAGAKTKVLSGSPDLVAFRLKRKTEAKSADGFHLHLSDVRVNALAGAGDSYRTDQVVSDVFTKLGALTTHVQTAGAQGIPADLQDSTANALLDDVSLLDDRTWVVLDDGTHPDYQYHDWGGGAGATWHLTNARFPVDLLPVERYNQVVVPYRGPGGVRLNKRVTASPNPLPVGVTNTFVLPLNDPLPNEGLATAYATVIATLLSKARWSGAATFNVVQNGSGANKPATKVKVGDLLELDNYSSRDMRVSDLTLNGDQQTVTVQFPAGHPHVDRILARRNLSLARGRPQAGATINSLGLKQPATPTLPASPLTFHRRRKEDGHQVWDVTFNWNPVFVDTTGSPTAIKKYEAWLRYRDKDSGALILDDDGNTLMQHRVIHERHDHDSASDDPQVRTRCRFLNLEHPTQYTVECMVKAYDFVDKDSDASSWSSAALPTTSKAVMVPGKVASVTTKSDHKAVIVKWTPPTTWSDGSSTDFSVRDIDHYEVDLYTSTGTLVNQHLHVLHTQTRFRFDSSGADLDTTKTYKAKVRAIGKLGDYQTEDAAAGTASPTLIVLGSDTSGDISDLPGSITKSQAGSLGVSRYGTYAAMNAASAVAGDIWIATTRPDGTTYASLGLPSHPYRYSGSAWTDSQDGAVLQAGTVIADAVVAGAIDGMIITGATVQTASSGQRIVMSAALGPWLQMYDSSHSNAGGLEVPSSGTIEVIPPHDLGDTTGGVVLKNSSPHSYLTGDCLIGDSGMKLGFFGGTVRAKQTINQRGDSTGVAGTGAVVAVSGSGADVAINNNFHRILTTLNDLLVALQSASGYNLIGGS